MNSVANETVLDENFNAKVQNVHKSRNSGVVQQKLRASVKAECEELLKNRGKFVKKTKQAAISKTLKIV